MTQLPHGLLVAGLWVLWPLVFGALAGRILGLRGSRVRGVLAGLAGASAGRVITSLLDDQLTTLQSFATFLAVAMSSTVAVITLLEFTASPAENFGRPGPLRRPKAPWHRGRDAWRRAIRYIQIARILTRSGLTAV